MNKTIFINKPPTFSEVMVLIFKFKSIFQTNEKRIFQFSLKKKTTESN